MKVIEDNGKEIVLDIDIISAAEAKYSITILKDFIAFLKENAGGVPKLNYVTFGNKEYEVRKFLSLDKADNIYGLEKPLDYFLENTHGKIIPFGVDSGDNYYCVNNETGKVYFWRASLDEYYPIASNIHDFENAFVV